MWGEGTYTVRKRYTTRFGWHLYVNHVEGREGILIHTFNDALEESLGCIIGDIHGFSSKLCSLLTKLGYTKNDGSFTHPTHKAIFVDDYIDREPEIRALNSKRNIVMKTRSVSTWFLKVSLNNNWLPNSYRAIRV